MNCTPPKKADIKTSTFWYSSNQNKRIISKSETAKKNNVRPN